LHDSYSVDIQPAKAFHVVPSHYHLTPKALIFIANIVKGTPDKSLRREIEE
jgi:hypothetical protein